MSTENGKKIPRLKRRQKIIIILLCGLLLYSLAGFYLVPWLLQTQSEKRLSLLLGRQSTIDRVQFNPFTLVLRLEGFVIKSRGSDKSPLCKIDNLLADFSSFSLFKRALILERLKVAGPYVKIVRKADLSYNFSDLLPAPKAKTEKKNESGSFHFSLNNIEIKSGIIELADQPHKTFHWINSITISLPSISNLPKLIDSRVQPSFAAVVNGAPLELKGQTKPFASSHDTEFNINFADLDLSYYLAYIPGKRNFTVTSGRLSTNLVLAFQQPANSPDRLQLSGTATLADVIIESNRKNEEHRFVNLPKTTIKFGPGNLLAEELFIDDITLENPDVNLKFKPDGVFHLPFVAAAVEKKIEQRSRHEGESKETKKQKFTCRISHLKINHGKLNFHDERVSPVFNANYKPFDLEVSNFSNEPEKQAEYTLKVTSDAAEALQVDGNLIFKPLTLKTRLKLENVPINRYQPYYRKLFNGNVNSGYVTADGELNFIQKAGKQAETSLDNFTLKLKALEVNDPDDTRVLTLPELKVVAERIDIDKQDIIITSCQARDGILKILRRADGKFNLMDFIPPEKDVSEVDKEVEPAVNDNQATGWHVLLQQGGLKNFQVELNDQALKTTATLVADRINLELDQLGTRPTEKGRIKIDLGLARTGEMSVSGTLALTPPEAELDITLKKLPLKAFQPYLAENIDMVLVNGQLQTSGKLYFKQETSEKPQLSLQGNASVRKLKIVDGVKTAEFLAWQDVTLHKFSFKPQPLTFSLDKLTATGLKSQILILPDGRSNLQVMMGKKPAAKKSPDKNPEPIKQPRPEPLDITLKKVLINQSNFSFTDQSMSPVFHLELADLKGEINGLSSRNQEPSIVNLQGSLNGQSPVLVKGSIAPLTRNLFIDLAISGQGIGMTTFTPYSGKFIGQTIGKGKLYLDLKYKVEKGQLQAENMIFLDQFDFGTQVESPDALSLPVKLAVALLRDRRGEIHLNIPVHGDLNDPKFSLGGVIVKIFINLITKAVTSPFALLGSLAGDGSQDLNHVLFAPGLAQLTEKAKGNLDKLAKILYERPGLKLEIAGHADPVSDRPALHEAYFQKLLKAQKFKEVVRKDKAVASVDNITIEKPEFKTYLWQAYKNSPIAKQKNLLGMVKKIPPEDQERLLRASIKVDDGALLDLARQRKQAVMSYLAGKGPVETQRLFLMEPVLAAGKTSSGVDNRLVEMKIK
ncbi:MAG: DUF748 domain-containing protein [Pseudomonadota bacterium]|nr:DUF748 domain-containing protein [Pseudomonadota bacterium]